jgi:preprotein translocase subunit SecF
VPLGIDFSGGTLVRVQFEQAVTEDQVRDALDSIPGDKVVQQFGPAADRQIMIRLPLDESVEQGVSLEQGARRVEEALQKAGLPKFEILVRDLVGPVIGADLQRKGIYATLASIIAITIYIAVRFRPSFAIGAIAATFHDILVTLAFLQFFKYELSLNVVAAILTITGYSVNDTIVIFDRVRENMRNKRREPLEQVVNTAVNQTLGRTVITAGTTFLSVLSLYIFGGEALRGFSFTMLVGIISGTYSTIFIASAIAILLSKKPQTAVAPAEASSRKQKGAKAS